MKRILVYLLVLCLGLGLAACAPADTNAVAAPQGTATKALEIGEKMFLTQINDIYYNFDDYRDAQVTLEGMYDLFYGPDDGDAPTVPVVYRNGPGCCENDGWGGFLLRYDGQYPALNSWIRVTGTPQLVERDGYQDLYLNVTALEVKSQRGAEYVAQ